MKKLMTMIAIAILTIGTAFAQENANRSDSNTVVRGPYLTNNNFFDNTFIGVGGGVNTFVAKDINFLPITPGINAEAFLGKWYTPTIGTRIGYKGLTNVVEQNTKYWQHYVHGDFMWNLSNALGGYKETRFWDVIPYVTAGAYDIVNQANGHNLEYGAGAGIYNKIRLTDRVNLYLDINTLVVRANAYLKTPHRFGFTPSASFGIVINLGKNTGFKRSSTVLANYCTVSDYNDVVAKNKEYESKVNCLENQNKGLQATVDSLNKVKPEIKEIVKEVPVNEVSVYFEKGKYVVSEKELSHLIDYAKSVDSTIVVKVIGSADSKEGSVERNQFLSEQRAKVVKDILINKFGFDEKNIVVETAIDVADTPERSRVAIVK
jgi:outer membrane protein OmpA-like peptidoglycan-associated protein